MLKRISENKIVIWIVFGILIAFAILTAIWDGIKRLCK